MARLFTPPAGHVGKFVVLAVVALVYLAAASQAGKFEKAQKNETSSFLPGSAESVKTLKAVERYPGGELAPAVVVFERRSGLRPGDRRRIDGTVARLNTNRKPLVLPAQKPVYARDGKAAIVVQPVKPGEGQSDLFQAAAQSIRDRAGGPSGGLDVKMTAPPASASTRSRSSTTSTAACCSSRRGSCSSC